MTTRGRPVSRLAFSVVQGKTPEEKGGLWQSEVSGLVNQESGTLPKTRNITELLQMRRDIAVLLCMKTPFFW